MLIVNSFLFIPQTVKGCIRKTCTLIQRSPEIRIICCLKFDIIIYIFLFFCKYAISTFYVLSLSLYFIIIFLILLILNSIFFFFFFWKWIFLKDILLVPSNVQILLSIQKLRNTVLYLLTLSASMLSILILLLFHNCTIFLLSLSITILKIPGIFVTCRS